MSVNRRFCVFGVSAVLSVASMLALADDCDRDQKVSLQTNPNNQTDLTPMLAWMTTGCGVQNQGDIGAMPETVEVIRKTNFEHVVNINEATDEYGTHIMSMTLKNANAFGLSVSKIEQLNGYEYAGVKVYFDTNNVGQITPLFQPPHALDATQVYLKPDNVSYEFGNAGIVALTVDFNEHTILCETYV